VESGDDPRARASGRRWEFARLAGRRGMTAMEPVPVRVVCRTFFGTREHATTSYELSNLFLKNVYFLPSATLRLHLQHTTPTSAIHGSIDVSSSSLVPTPDARPVNLYGASRSTTREEKNQFARAVASRVVASCRAAQISTQSPSNELHKTDRRCNRQTWY